MLLYRQLVREYSLAIGVVSCDVGRHVTPDEGREKVFYGKGETEMHLEDGVPSRKCISANFWLSMTNSNTQVILFLRTNNCPGDRQVISLRLARLRNRTLDFGIGR